MYVKNLNCPACGSLTRTQGSRNLHTLLRRSYAYCDNHLCGASWQLSIEVTAILSPTSSLYANNAPALPDAMDDGDAIYELALLYISNHPTDIDSTLTHCPRYLQQQIGIDAATADIVTRQVLINHDKADYIGWLGWDMATGDDVSVTAPVMGEDWDD